MNLSAPYSIMNTQIDYYTHNQNNRYINSLGQGILKMTQDQTASLTNSANQINESIQSGFNEIAYQQAELQSLLMEQSDGLRSDIQSMNFNIEVGFEEIAKGLVSIDKSINRGFSEVCNGLQDLKSSFDMGMMNIVSQFEMQRAEISQGFINLNNTLTNTKKTEANERYNDGKTEFEKYIKLPDEPQFLIDAFEYFQKSIDIFKGNPFCHLYLGHIYKEPQKKFYDLKLSFEHYKLCSTYAKGINNNELTAIGYFMAAWVLYVLKDVDQAIEFSELSLQFDSKGIPENYYNLAKYYAYQKNAPKSLENLDIAIKQFDPNYSVKASLDYDFTKIHSELKTYFINLRDSEKNNLEGGFSNFGL